MKKLMLALVGAAMLGSVSLYAEASDCPKDVKPCPKEMCKKDCPKEMRKKGPDKCKMLKNKNGKKFDKKAPDMKKRPNFSPEQREEMKKFFDAVKEYKANPTEENKAKVIELLNKGYDKRLAESEKRLAELKEKVAEIEKRNADMKANRDAEVQKHFDRIINFKKTEMPKK